jgi:hypothetical protein
MKMEIFTSPKKFRSKYKGKEEINHLTFKFKEKKDVRNGFAYLASL